MHRPGPPRVLVAVVSLLAGLFIVAAGGAWGLGRQPAPPSTTAPSGGTPSPGATGGSSAPAAPGAPGAKKMLVVGDSVIKGLEVYGALPVLQAALPGYDIAFDAEESRSTVAGAGVIQSKNPAQFDTVVVSLGTNDAGSPAVFQSRVKTVLDELKTVPHVYWMNIHEKGRYAPQYAQSNAALSQVATFYPNTTVIDWNAFANTLPQSQFAADGLHLSGASAKAMASLIADSVKGTSKYAKAGAPTTTAAAPPSTTGAQGAATSGAGGQGNDQGSSSSNNGLIIGIVVGAVLLLGFLAAALAGWRRSRSRRREERKARLDALFGSTGAAEPGAEDRDEVEHGDESRAADGTDAADAPAGEATASEGDDLEDAGHKDAGPDDIEPPPGSSDDEPDDPEHRGAAEVEVSPEPGNSSGT